MRLRTAKDRLKIEHSIIEGVREILEEMLTANPDKLADAKSNPKAIGWFVGQVMKASGGKANPQAVNELLRRKLGI